MAIDKDVSPGTVLMKRYRIAERVGVGGMGSVYRAVDLQREGMEVAVKTLRDEYSGDAVYVERFVREVELLNKINHPNIVQTFDIGSEGGILFYVMEFVRGTSLEQILEHGPFPLQDIPKLTLHICEGLQAIHDAEIIHRDLKPGNVLLLDNGSLKITDFGVARPKVSNLTRKDQRVGSIWYMPPEAWQGKKLTRAADLYSLGILLYECVTGDVPFEGDTPSELMRQHLSSKAPAPNRLRKDTPQWLNNLILELLAKLPEDRPRNATDVARIVDGHSGGSSAKAKTAADPRPNKIPGQSLKQWKVDHRAVAKGSKRRRKVTHSAFSMTGMGIVLSAAVAALVAYLFWSGRL